MMKKLCSVLLLSFLLLLGSTPVFASHFTKVRRIVLTVPKTSGDYVYDAFRDNGKTIFFLATQANSSQCYLYCYTNKKTLGIFDSAKILWTTQDKMSSNSYRSYTIQQLQDTDTGRYFYAIDCNYAMDGSYHALLLGLDDKKKNIIEYINSDNMQRPKYGDDFWVLQNENLYLNLGPLGQRLTTLYKIDWSEKDKWFGYTYVPELAMKQ